MSTQRITENEGRAIYRESIKRKIGVWANKLKAEGSSSRHASRTRMFYMVCYDVEAGKRVSPKTSSKSKWMDAIIDTAMEKMVKNRDKTFIKRNEHKDTRYSYEIDISVYWALPSNGKNRAPVTELEDHRMVLATLTADDEDLEAYSPWGGSEAYRVKKRRDSRWAERAKRSRLDKEIEKIYGEEDTSVQDAIIHQISTQDGWLKERNPITPDAQKNWPNEPHRHTEL